MSNYSSMHVVAGPSHSRWAVALCSVLLAGLAACAPVAPAVNPAAAQPASAGLASTAAPQLGAPGPAARAADGPLAVPPNLLPLTRPAGQKRLTMAASSQSYWPLSQYFETQRNQAYCSVATSVMALNALGIRRPESSLYPDFPFYSQEDFFRSIDPQVANAAQVSREGMTLDQLDAALKAFPIDVRKYHAAGLTLGQFRDLIRQTTAHGDRFALLNFRRVEIGEEGGGHWSPLAAYDSASDSALLMDVARYKYPAVWVPVAQLYAAALAVDNVSGLSRGVVIISRRSN